MANTNPVHEAVDAALTRQETQPDDHFGWLADAALDAIPDGWAKVDREWVRVVAPDGHKVPCMLTAWRP